MKCQCQIALRVFTNNIISLLSKKIINFKIKNNFYLCITLNFEKAIDFIFLVLYNVSTLADVLELADGADSKSVAGDSVWVQVPPSAPYNDVSFDTEKSPVLLGFF